MSLIKVFKKGFVLLAITASLRGYTQFNNTTPGLLPSPNSSSMLRYGNTPINLYTGLAYIGADLHSLQARNYNIPIRLNYNASGIKVQDVASTVGLGWSLNVNSIITRVVRGLPDEDPVKGYFTGGMGAQLTLTQSTVEEIISGNKDVEPDVFYANINGMNAKFVFDRNKTPVYLNDNNLRLINSPFKKELGLEGWILEDLVGNRYFFGDNADYVEKSQVTQFLDSGLPLIKEYNSTWFLSKITTANSFENIFYQYNTGSPIKTTIYIKNKKYSTKLVTRFVPPKRIIFIINVQIKEGSFDSESTDEYLSEWDGNIETYVAEPKYLSSITSSNEKVLFHYKGESRLDLPGGKILDKIEVQNHKNETLKFIALNYTYQNSYPDGRLNEPEALRLSLDNIQLKDKTSTNSRQLFSFTYSSQRLPLRNSVKTDHWGYYSRYGEAFMLPDQSNARTFKEADPVLMPAGTLSKITYETGGFKEFLYECNSYYNYIEKKNKNAGGLRIASIKTFAQSIDPAPQIVTYQYYEAGESGTSSGKIIIPHNSYISYIDYQKSEYNALYMGSGTIKVIAPKSQPQPLINTTVPVSSPIPQVPLNQPDIQGFVSGLIDLFSKNEEVNEYYSPFKYESSVSYNDRFDDDGTIVGYSTVTEKINSDNGFTVSKFTDAKDFPDGFLQYRIKANMARTGGELSQRNPPFTPTTSYAFARGLLKEQIVYNNSHVPVKKVLNKYVEHIFAEVVKGMRVSVGRVEIQSNQAFKSNTQDTYYNYGEYYIIPRRFLLSETEELVGSPLAISQKVTYQYDPVYPSLLKSKKVSNSNGEVIESQYKYVSDKDAVNYDNQSETDAANTLFNGKRYGLLLEEAITNNTTATVLKKEKVGYKNWTLNAIPFTLPQTVYSGKSSLKPRIQYTYDTHGNIVQVSNAGGIKSGTIWGHSAFYPVAEARNAGPEEVFFEDFEELSSSTIQTGNAHSGNKCYQGAYAVNFIRPNTRTYKISYYYYSNNKWNYSGFKPYTGATTLDDGEYIDKVVIIPDDAQLSSSTINPAIGVTSTTGVNGQTTYFEYDSFLRPTIVRDQNGNIIKKTDYHIKP